MTWLSESPAHFATMNFATMNRVKRNMQMWQNIREHEIQQKVSTMR
jgi:hypothetical protein